MVNQAYLSKMMTDETAAIALSKDPGIEHAMKEGNRTAIKAIVDEYCQNAPVNYVITVVDYNGTVMARSATNQSGDNTMNTRLLMALNGNGSAVTDVLSAQVIVSNGLWDEVNATGMTEGLAMINTQPVRDDDRHVIGAVSIAEILNSNFEIVDTITNQTGCFDELIRRNVCAQIDDFKGCAFQHHADQVLTNIVQITLDCTGDNLPARRNIRLDQVRLQLCQTGFHRPGRDQHLGHEIFAFFKQAADFTHCSNHTIVQDHSGIYLFLQSLFHVGGGLSVIAIKDGLEQQVD